MATTPEQQARINKLTEDYNELVKAGKKDEEATLALKEKIEELEKSALSSAEERLEKRQEELDLLQSAVDLTGDILEQNTLRIAQDESQLQYAQELNGEHLKEAELLKQRIDAGEDVDGSLANQLASLQQTIKHNDLFSKQLEKQIGQHKQNKEAADGMSVSVEQTVSGLLGSVDASQTMMGKFMGAAKHAGGIGGALKLVGKGLSAALNPANIMAGLFQKIGQSTLMVMVGMDQFRADLTKAGGSLEEYGDVMNDVRDTNVAAGVGMQQATGAILALHKGMSDFNNMAKADQAVLTSQVAVMDKLGASAESVVGNIDTMTKAMGMSAKEATIANKQIAATADALGTSVAGAMEDFAKAGPKLAAHGKAGIQVFRELQTQAKATGLAMDDLLSITEGFDTFQGAAELTATLNATLGTTLNSSEMLLATEAERIVMMKASLAATGKSWESMDRWERKQAAAVLTGGDLSKAAKLMTADLNSTASAAEKAAMADGELQKKAANATTAKEKMTLIMERFGVAVMPVLNLTHKLLDGIMKINEYAGGYFVPGILALVAALKAWFVITGLIRAREIAALTLSGLRTAAKAAETTATLAGAAATGVEAGAEAGKTAAKLSGAAASGAEAAAEAGKTAAKLGGAAATGAQAGAVGALAVSETAQAGAAAAATPATGGFAAAVKALGKALMQSALGLLAFGAAMLMVGAGIYIAAIGLAKLVQAFAGLNPAQIIGATIAIALFGITIIALVVTLGILAYTGLLPLVALGLLAFGAAAMMMGFGIMMAAAGLSLMVDSFTRLFEVLIPNLAVLPALAVGLVLLALGVYTLAASMVVLALVTPAMLIAALGLAGMSIALFQFGMGATIAGIGLMIFATGLGLLVLMTEPLIQIGLAILAMGVGMSMLMMSMAGFGVMSMFLLPIIATFGVLTYAILALAAALAFIKTEDLQAVADMAKGLGSMTIESAVAFGSAMVDTKQTIIAIAKQPEAATLLEKTVKAFAPTPAAPATAAPGVAGGPAGGGAPGGAAGGERTVILKLNEREFAKAVVNILEKTQNLATAT